MIGYRVLLKRRGGFRVMAKPAAVTRYPNSALFVLNELAPSYQGMAAIKVIERFRVHPTVPHTTTQRANRIGVGPLSAPTHVPVYDPCDRRDQGLH